MSSNVKTPKVKKPTEPKDHPPYIQMIKAALTDLQERGGSSRQAIYRYIETNYKVKDGFQIYVRNGLKKGCESNMFVHTKGSGASGSFKLAQKSEPKKKPVVPKEKVSKPKATESTDGKKVKKPRTPKPKSSQKKSVKAAEKKKSPAKRSAAAKPRKATAAKAKTAKLSLKPKTVAKPSTPKKPSSPKKPSTPKKANTPKKSKASSTKNPKK